MVIQQEKKIRNGAQNPGPLGFREIPAQTTGLDQKLQVFQASIVFPAPGQGVGVPEEEPVRKEGFLAAHLLDQKIQGGTVYSGEV